MKLAEVRKELAKYTKAELIEQYAAAYRKVPKAVREEELDPIIISGVGKAPVKKKEDTADFGALSTEIDTFINNVGSGYYLAANRVVPKAKRSKWRFDVMRFYKELRKIPITDENYDAANDLLERLFMLLSEGCGEYIFTTTEPFASIQVEQVDFFATVAKRRLAASHDPEVISDLCALAMEVDLSSDSLHTDFYNILSELLQSREDKETALTVIRGFEKVRKKGKKSMLRLNDGWNYLYSPDEAGELYTIISCGLHQEEEGAAYWASISKERDKEVTLYCILMAINSFGSDAAWVHVYEKAVQEKITPRKELQEMYRKKKAELDEEE